MNRLAICSVKAARVFEKNYQKLSLLNDEFYEKKRTFMKGRDFCRKKYGPLNYLFRVFHAEIFITQNFITMFYQCQLFHNFKNLSVPKVTLNSNFVKA